VCKGYFGLLEQATSVSPKTLTTTTLSVSGNRRQAIYKVRWYVARQIVGDVRICSARTMELARLISCARPRRSLRNLESSRKSLGLSGEGKTSFDDGIRTARRVPFSVNSAREPSPGLILGRMQGRAARWTRAGQRRYRVCLERARRRRGLCPTRGPDGRPDSRRIDAVGNAVRTWAAPGR